MIPQKSAATTNLPMGHAKFMLIPTKVFHLPDTDSMAQTKHTVLTPIAATPKHLQLIRQSYKCSIVTFHKAIVLRDPERKNTFSIDGASGSVPKSCPYKRLKRHLLQKFCFPDIYLHSKTKSFAQLSKMDGKPDVH